MAVFVTGTTGYLGSYIAQGLLRNHRERLALLVRAKSQAEAAERLWKSVQLHMEFDEFDSYLRDRVELYLGDLTSHNLGLDQDIYKKLVHQTDSIVHCAASLNRRSEKACLNVNLRGTLEVVKVARAAQDHHGLRRFSDVSTVAVAGCRNHESVTEDEAIDWNRSDYDPYARTKKFCEHMIHELLPEVPHTIFRPSIVLGDSRFPQTTQFDMARAFFFFSRMPLLPFHKNWKLDIVPADFVGKAITEIHQKEKPEHTIYHLSSGKGSLTCGEIVKAMNQNNIFVPLLNKPFTGLVQFLTSTPRVFGISGVASLIKVFLPYLTYDTVFDNTRIVNELHESPVPFKDYALDLLRFVKDGKFAYAYKPWPQNVKREIAA